MRLIVAITGASGAIYGIRLLEQMRGLQVETHLIISNMGKATITKETSYSVDQVRNLATRSYEETDLASSISSGSFKCDGMIVIPCSMKTLSGIANGYSDGLIIRAADVSIKEQRKMVLAVRETPLNSIHLENMLKLSRLGVVIMPPMPAFYCLPDTLDDMINQTVARILDQFGITTKHYKAWEGEELSRLKDR